VDTIKSHQIIRVAELDAIGSDRDSQAVNG